MRDRTLVWVLMVGAIMSISITSSQRASAQLVVANGDANVTAAHYIVVREGQRTVLYLQLAVDDAAKGAFDVVIPITSAKAAPQVLLPDQAAMFGYLDHLTAPRLVEYWEQDPCEFHTVGPDDGIAERDVKDATPAPASPVQEPVLATLHSVEDVVAALQGRGRSMPPGADAILASYASAGAAFVVATAHADATTVSARMDLDSSKLVLPFRLLSVHAASQPQVKIDVLGTTSRFEAANRPNLAAPANTNVKADVKGSTSVFHERVLAQLFAARPQAVVTEYAWRATSCAPCTGPPLSASNLAALGLGGATKDSHEVMIFTEGNVTAKPDGPPALRKALLACYAKALTTTPAASGEVSVAVEIADGRATAPKGSTKDAPAVLVACAQSAVAATAFDGTGTNGTVRVQFMPMSRKFVADVVVTRMRAQAGPSEAADIELREGTPIAGGAEVGPSGGPNPGVYAAEKANHFQSRYTVRHAWAGAKPTCASPKPNVWGGPPEGTTPKPPGKTLADDLEVANHVVGEPLAVDALTMSFQPRNVVPKPAPASPVEASAPAQVPAEMPAPTPPPHSPPNQWVGVLALGVCVVALYLSQRAQA